jgi:hypothetical protein
VSRGRDRRLVAGTDRATPSTITVSGAGDCDGNTSGDSSNTSTGNEANRIITHMNGP